MGLEALPDLLAIVQGSILLHVVGRQDPQSWIRTSLTARQICVFTVPRGLSSTRAISLYGSLSTNLSMRTER